MCQFQVTPTVSLGDIAVFVFENLGTKFAHTWSQWSLQIPGYTFGGKF